MEYGSATHDAIRHFILRWAKSEIEIKWMTEKEKKNAKKIQQHNILSQVKLVYYIHKFNIFEVILLPDTSYAECRNRLGWILSIAKLKAELHRKVNVKVFKAKLPVNRFGSIIFYFYVHDAGFNSSFKYHQRLIHPIIQ